MGIKKRTGLLASALLMSLATFAQEDIVVYLNEAPARTYALDKVGKWTFADGNLVVNGDTNNAMALSSIRTIRFRGQTTAVIPLPDSKPGAEILLSANQVSARSWNAAKGIAIYAANGQLVIQDKNWHGEPLDLSGLNHGFYILKTSVKTIKFSK